MRGRFSYRKDDDDEDKYEEEMQLRRRLHDTDLYDQGLLELKKLVNEKKEASPEKQRSYNPAIKKTIADLLELSESIVPDKIARRDIKLALEGGKYRELYFDPSDENGDIIDLGDRKKKSSKPKPKRKPMKKITKKPVKKVVKKVIKKRK